MKKYGVTYIAYNKRRWLKMGDEIYSVSPERKPRIKEIKK